MLAPLPHYQPIFAISAARSGSFPFRLLVAGAIIAITGMLAGCAGPQAVLSPGAEKTSSLVLGRSEHYAVVQVGAGETYESLAERFLGDRSKAWLLREDPLSSPPAAGEVLAVPLRASNLVGVRAGGFQKIPILSYHHFGPGRGKLTVTEDQFRSQLEYLRDNGFTIVPLAYVIDFLAGKRKLPARSVVLTIDDGYRSAYEVAYPILTEYGYPATVFVYSDFVGRGGLTWSQLEEMSRSGLISIQAHSKSHADLTVLQDNESTAAYAARIRREVDDPKRAIEKRLPESVHSYAYPFGAANAIVVNDLPQSDYRLGLTVKRGGNPFFTNPLLLRRTMIFGGDSTQDFANALDVFEPTRQP